MTKPSKKQQQEQHSVVSSFYHIEKISLIKHRLYSTTVYSDGTVDKQLVREDIPRIVASLLLRQIYDAPFVVEAN